MFVCPMCEEEADLTTSVVDKEVVTDLASALRRRDFAEAEAQLDKLVEDHSDLKWAVNLGRFGGRAKAA